MNKLLTPIGVMVLVVGLMVGVIAVFRGKPKLSAAVPLVAAFSLVGFGLVFNERAIELTLPAIGSIKADARKVQADAELVESIATKVEKQAYVIEQLSESIENAARDISIVVDDVERMQNELTSIRRDVDQIEKPFEPAPASQLALLPHLQLLRQRIERTENGLKGEILFNPTRSYGPANRKF